VTRKMSPYRKPPITEAIIEFRTAEIVPDKLVDKAASAIRKRYPRAEYLHEFTVKLGAPTNAAPVRIGHKLFSEAGDYVAQPRRRGFALSSLAPYPGWARFTAELEEVWGRWKKAVGPRRLDRIGVRFINRIDVPWVEGERLDSDDYLRVGIKLPESSGNFSSAWQVATVSPVRETPFEVTIRAGTTDPALFGHASFVLDLDLHCAVDVPQADADIFALLAKAKVAKNQVFEECITDQTRALLA